MSFNFNSKEVTAANFNGEEVKTVNFNGVQVWTSASDETKIKTDLGNFYFGDFSISFGSYSLVFHPYCNAQDIQDALFNTGAFGNDKTKIVISDVTFFDSANNPINPIAKTLNIDAIKTFTITVPKISDDIIIQPDVYNIADLNNDVVYWSIDSSYYNTYEKGFFADTTNKISTPYTTLGAGLGCVTENYKNFALNSGTPFKPSWSWYLLDAFTGEYGSTAVDSYSSSESFGDTNSNFYYDSKDEFIFGIASPYETYKINSQNMKIISFTDSNEVIFSSSQVKHIPFRSSNGFVYSCYNGSVYGVNYYNKTNTISQITRATTSFKPIWSYYSDYSFAGFYSRGSTATNQALSLDTTYLTLYCSLPDNNFTTLNMQNLLNNCGYSFNQSTSNDYYTHSAMIYNNKNGEGLVVFSRYQYNFSTNKLDNFSMTSFLISEISESPEYHQLIVENKSFSSEETNSFSYYGVVTLDQSFILPVERGMYFRKGDSWKVETITQEQLTSNQNYIANQMAMRNYELSDSTVEIVDN